MFTGRNHGPSQGGRFRRRVPLLLALALCLPLVRFTAPVAVADAPTVPVKLALPTGNVETCMTSAQCVGCHATVPELSHPVNLVPTLAIPASWPLENGRLACTTCHLDSIADHTAGNGALLRGNATGAAFCTQCHPGQSNTRQSQHPLAIAKAHLLRPAGLPSSSDAGTSAEGDGINTCLACHDGAVAPDAYGGLGAAAGKGKANHPVGVTYPSTTLHRGDAAFNTVSTIDRRVRLTGGQVTCNACHSLYSPLPGLMVMRNDRSVLCLTCHAQ